MPKDKNKLVFRKATMNDLALLKHWDTQVHVQAADPDDDWNWEVELDREPVWREQLISEIEGEAIGMVQIIDPQLEETQYWGTIGANYRAIDIWIGEEQNLNQGYGTVMMELVLERCFANEKVIAILIDPLASNIKAHRFYERLGFEFVEKRQFNETDCYVYQMTRAQWTSRAQ